MEPFMHFRKTNTDPSVHFRMANTDPSMHFRKANTEYLLPFLLQTFFLSLFHFHVYFCFYSQFNPNMTTNLLHHNECNEICLSSNSKLSPLYSLCFIHSFLFCSKVVSLQFPANGPCRKRLTLQNVCTRRSPIQVLT